MIKQIIITKLRTKNKLCSDSKSRKTRKVNFVLSWGSLAFQIGRWQGGMGEGSGTLKAVNKR
jgi:hypothetical protein